MLRRIVLPIALCAVAVIGGGVAAWRWHVATISARLDNQAAVASAFLASAPAMSDPAGVVRAIGGPEIDVVLFDRASGEHYAWVDGKAVRHRALGPGEPPMPPP